MIILSISQRNVAYVICIKSHNIYLHRIHGLWALTLLCTFRDFSIDNDQIINKSREQRNKTEKKKNEQVTVVAEATIHNPFNAARITTSKQHGVFKNI